MFTGGSSLHFHGEVYTRWCAQAKRSRNLLQVELVNVENVSLLVAGVGLEVGAVAVLGRTVQVVVPLDQLHELVLDARQLLHGEFVLVWPHLLLAEEAEEAELMLKQEEEGATSTL